MKKVPTLTLRFESSEQMDKFKKAAKKMRWSLNTFMIVGAEALTLLPLADKLKLTGITNPQEEK